ncbi:MAG: rod shape-determining protein RodA [Candidatus Krumholzibacteriia bacterium]
MRSLSWLLPGGDLRILAAYLLLCMFSLLTLWSVTEGIHGPYQGVEPDVPKSVFWRQAMWMAVSFVALAIAARIPLRHLENLALPVYLGAVALLLVTLVAGTVVAGSRRWLVAGPLSVQPSELAKVATILLLASVLGRRSGRRSLPTTLLSLLLAVVPFLLVFKEPDLGTSLVFLALWVGLVFWYGIPGVFLLWAASAAGSAILSFYSESVAQNPWPWAVFLLLLMGLLYMGRFGMLTSSIILGTNVLTGLGIPMLWEKLRPYQQTRIMAFFDPQSDAFGSGYQAIQSQVAIGSGGLFGTHYLQGTQKGLAFLPERHTDFIFSVIGEELGFAGAVAVLALFAFLVLRAIDLAGDTRRPFAAYLAVGAASYFTFHVAVNVSITTGLLPVTGLPLPLISYGGSNLLVSSVLVGFLLNISSRRAMS